MISFDGVPPAGPASGPDVPTAGEAATGSCAGRLPVAAAAPPASEVPALPRLQLTAGYEMYRDETRTVIRKPGEPRWGATVRTGPTSHRFVAAGEDPAALWSLAGRAAATQAAA